MNYKREFKKMWKWIAKTQSTTVEYIDEKDKHPRPNNCSYACQYTIDTFGYKICSYCPVESCCENEYIDYERALIVTHDMDKVKQIATNISKTKWDIHRDMKWIDTDTELPQTSTNSVIVLLNNGSMDIGYYKKGEWHIGVNKTEAVIKWMPLNYNGQYIRVQEHK